MVFEFESRNNHNRPLELYTELAPAVDSLGMVLRVVVDVVIAADRVSG